jgi:ribonucleoside-diphosphate reductase beta chain
MSYGKVHQDSKPTVNSGLDYFEVPSTNTSVLEGKDVTIFPVRDPNGAIIEYQYQTDGFTHIDGNNSFIHMQGKVVKADGTDIENNADNVKVMPAPNFMNTLFAHAEAAFGSQHVSYDANYAYSSYLENLLTYGKEFKKSVGASFGWVEDEAGIVDRTDITAAMVGDIKARKTLIAGSKTVDLAGSLNIPIFRQHKYLPPNLEINIRLTKSDPAFYLIKTEDHTTGYKFEITKCDLHLRLLKVHPSIINAHNSLLLGGNTYKFPLNKVETRMFTITDGKQSERINLVLNQQKPKRIFLALLDHDAKNGSYDKNPFKFQPFQVTSLVLDIDGQPHPSKPIKTDFENDMFSEAFFLLAQSTGKSYVNGDLGITRSQYKKNCAIFGFDLTSDLCEGGGVHLIKNCNITLDIAFKQQLGETISLFMYAEKDELLEIDHEKVVHRLTRV